MKIFNSKILIYISIPNNINVSLVSDEVTCLTYLNFKGLLNNFVVCIPNRVIVTLLKDKILCIVYYLDSKTLSVANTLKKQIIKKLYEVNNYSILKLFLEGIGYKATLLENNKLQLEVGYSHTINIMLPKTIHTEITLKGTCIILKGNDYVLLTRLGSIIKSIRKVEPYKGKGIRKSSELIKLKQGKK